MGLYAAAGAGALIGLVSAIALPFCDSPNLLKEQLVVIGASTATGVMGSLVLCPTTVLNAG